MKVAPVQPVHRYRLITLFYASQVPMSYITISYASSQLTVIKTNKIWILWHWIRVNFISSWLQISGAWPLGHSLGISMSRIMMYFYFKPEETFWSELVTLFKTRNPDWPYAKHLKNDFTHIFNTHSGLSPLWVLQIFVKIVLKV